MAKQCSHFAIRKVKMKREVSCPPDHVISRYIVGACRKLVKHKSVIFESHIYYGCERRSFIKESKVIKRIQHLHFPGTF